MMGVEDDLLALHLGKKFQDAWGRIRFRSMHIRPFWANTIFSIGDAIRKRQIKKKHCIAPGKPSAKSVLLIAVQDPGILGKNLLQCFIKLRLRYRGASGLLPEYIQII